MGSDEHAREEVVAQMRMLRWMYGATELDRIRGSFHIKSPRVPHDPSQMFPKKLLKIPQCVLMTL